MTTQPKHRPPKAWASRVKLAINAGSRKVFRRDVWALNIYQRFGEAPRWQTMIERRWQAFCDSALPYSLALLLLCVAVTVGWGIIAEADAADLWPEMGGMTFDVFFILIVFSAFEARRQRRQDISRQRETIDDYKRWDSEEGRVRLAGAIRRLNRLGVFSIDLSGSRLTDFSFRLNGISDISQSSFFNGDWGNMLNDASVRLVRTDFGWINCNGVTFSPFDPLGGLFDSIERHAQFVDCSFIRCSLHDARFDGASLKWPDPPPDSHYEWEEVQEGEVAPIRCTYGPFFEADLTGASFKKCFFSNADFRDAENILKADFTGASGLSDAIFDDEETKAAVLRMVKAANRE